MEKFNINWRIVKPSLWTGVASMVLGGILLAQVAGFMSPSSAEKLAVTRSDNAVVAALAPGCAADFRVAAGCKGSDGRPGRQQG